MFCDLCQSTSIDGGTQQYTSIEKLRADLTNSGWERLRGMDICPGCQKFPQKMKADIEKCIRERKQNQ